MENVSREEAMQIALRAMQREVEELEERGLEASANLVCAAMRVLSE